LPSILIHYRDNKIRTQPVRGIFRGIDWDTRGQSFTLVGDGGQIVKVQGEKSLVFKSGTRQNLRTVSTNPHDGTALIVGNAGTIILLDEDGNPSKINVSTAENLRATSWSSDGSVALIARNRGTLLKYTDLGVETVNGGTANLRR